MACLQEGEKVTWKLSKLLEEYNLNEVSVIYKRNSDKTYMFYVGFAWKILSSYSNPTEEDIKDMERGIAFQFSCNPEIMDVNEFSDMENLDEFVGANFQSIDLGQYLWDNGYCKTILFGLYCTKHGDFIEFNIAGEIYYVKDCLLELRCISPEKFRSVYEMIYQ